MCGITGAVHFRPIDALQASWTERAIQAIKTRGPNHQDQYRSPGVDLGHVRLAIVDLSPSGNQPMTDPSGRYTIVFNGEIFNFKKWKDELQVDYRGHSDTEVLLHLLIRYGTKILPELRGFFALALYDKVEHSLLLARDHYGIKPLHYAFDGQNFFFCSELKGLLQYPVKRKIDRLALESFFKLTYVPAPLSIFESVRKLRPGHFLKFEKGAPGEQTSFLPPSAGPTSMSYEEAQEELRRLMEESMEKWLLSDAPLGAFLSGGIDSSIVVALASQKVSKLKTYSVTFKDVHFHDESRYSRLVAQKYDTDHHEIQLDPSRINQALDGILDYLDEPFADTSFVPSYILCQEVGKDLRVSLSGDGADEVFGGYEKYKGEFWAQRLSVIKPAFKVLSPPLALLPQSRDGRASNFIRQLDRFSRGAAGNFQERYWDWCSFNKKEVLKKLFLQKAGVDSRILDEIVFKDLHRSGDLNETLDRDIRNVLPNDMLTKVDLASMAHSLEVRPVFLDPVIVEFARTLPVNFKITSKQRKRILLDTFKPLLPREVYDRPKHGFTIGLMPYLSKNLEKLRERGLFDQKFIKEQGLFNPEAVAAIEQGLASPSGPAGDVQALTWSYIVFQHFFRKFEVDL